MKSNPKRLAYLKACFMVLMALARGGQAETIVLNPLADTYIGDRFPNQNAGGEVTLVCGTQGTMAGLAKNRALFKFDPGVSIPPGASIDSVRFTLTVTQVPSTPAASRFELRRILRAWDVHQATWTLRLSPNISWGALGGQVNTDYTEVVSASAVLDEEVGSYLFASTAAASADVQSWLDDPSTNFGWILMTSQETMAYTARRIASADSPADRPQLEVDYTLPPAPRIASVALKDGAFSLRFIAEASYCYAVEYRNSVSAGPWSTLTNLCARLVAEEVVATDRITESSKRFYRLGITGRVR